MSLIVEIQQKLKAPKGQWNDFSKYHYRSAEDIVDAVKPLLHEKGLHLILSDEMVNLGDRFYVKATATVKEGDKEIDSATGYAREQETKKGMDEAQITGAASSYARKYALNGLFAIDDGKDADSDDNRQGTATQERPQATNSPQQKTEPEEDDKPWFNDDDLDKYRGKMIERIQGGEHPDEIAKSLRKTFKVSRKMAEQIGELV